MDKSNVAAAIVGGQAMHFIMENSLLSDVSDRIEDCLVWWI